MNKNHVFTRPVQKAPPIIHREVLKSAWGSPGGPCWIFRGLTGPRGSLGSPGSPSIPGDSSVWGHRCLSASLKYAKTLRFVKQIESRGNQFKTVIVGPRSIIFCPRGSLRDPGVNDVLAIASAYFLVCIHTYLYIHMYTYIYMYMYIFIFVHYVYIHVVC